MASKEFKIKVGDGEKNILVNKPNDTQETDADIYSSQVFAKLAKEKTEDGKPAYLVRAKLDEFLKEIGIYTIEDIQRLGTVAEEIGKLEDKLHAGQISKLDGKKTAIKLRELRYEMLLLLNKKAEYDKHTIEHHCQNARMDFLITKCITFENKEPIFKSVKDYKEDDVIKPLMMDAITYLASLVSNYDVDYEKNLIENKFLLKFNYCDEDLTLVDPETGQYVNEDGDPINEDGELIDKDGNVIDQDGDQVEKELGDFFDEDVTPKKTTKKRAAKKRAPKTKPNNK